MHCFRLGLVALAFLMCKAGEVFGADDSGATRPANVLQPPAPAPDAKSSPRDRSAFRNITSQGVSDQIDSLFATIHQGASAFGVLQVEFDGVANCQRFQAPGIKILSRFDRFADVFIKDLQDWNAVEKAPGVVWVELAHVGKTPPPPVRQTAKVAARPEEVVEGGVGDLKGRGVLIAVIDTGIDFRNPDFIRYEDDGRPTSRLLYFWDTFSDLYAGGQIGKKAPICYPNGASVGTIYSRDELTSELRAAAPRIPDGDTGGHGTACMGIAAGNGNNSNGRYRGVAPEADLITVRVGQGRSIENGYLLGSICDWLDEVAGDRPLVVSCSFGGQYGGRDGCRVEERRLDARFNPDRKGRALCIAAGNERMKRLHAGVRFGAVDQPGILEWDSGLGGHLDVYLKADDFRDIRVDAGAMPVALEGHINKLNKSYILTVDFFKGRGRLSLFNLRGVPMEGDAYIYGAEFDAGNDPPGKQIASPGMTTNAITVGSYDFNNLFDHDGQLDAIGVPDGRGHIVPLPFGDLSNYSNPGPGRIGDGIKPELTAPGRYFTASAARNTAAVRDTTGRYQLFAGTSAATPYVAGIVALLMQKRPGITTGEIKALIEEHATGDEKTGPVPNPDWGNGKLDLKAVKKILGVR